MEDHIPIRLDKSLLLGRQTSKWSLWNAVFHEKTLNKNSEKFSIWEGKCEIESLNFFIGLCLYLVSFQSGLGPVPWIVNAEVRGLKNSIHKENSS